MTGGDNKNHSPYLGRPSADASNSGTAVPTSGTRGFPKDVPNEECNHFKLKEMTESLGLKR